MLLEFCEGLPMRTVAAGERIIHDGARTDALYVLASGGVEVRKDGVRVAAHSEPGACFGEMSLLLGGTATADVDAVSSTTIYVLDNASEALRERPVLLFAVAQLLADRLRLVTIFLADIKRQYGDEHGTLAVVDNVLDALVRHAGIKADTGSEREPDPLY